MTRKGILSAKNHQYFYPEEFVQFLDESIVKSQNSAKSGAMLMVMLDNLAMILDAHGHEKSEMAVSSLIDRIKCSVDTDSNAFVQRIQRDIIGIIIPSLPVENIQSVANRINTLVQNFGNEWKDSIHVISSIGSIDFPKNCGNVTEAFDRAFIALKNRSTLNYAPYESGSQSQKNSLSQMELASYLNQSIKKGNLRLAYQPVISAKNGEIVHYEALLRHIDKDGKINSAGALIPIAEKMGMIEIIDQVVLDMVGEELIRSNDVRLAFNISNMTTEDTRWFEKLAKLARSHPEITSRMIIEITETAAQKDLRETAYFIASVQELGCLVALDDFGSGYTSFRQLKSLSVDMLKIDGSFVKDVAENADNRFFVKTLLDFTNGLGISSVAECVETGECAKVLMELGIDYMQGHYFAKALNYRSWLNEGEYKV